MKQELLKHVKKIGNRYVRVRGPASDFVEVVFVGVVKQSGRLTIAGDYSLFIKLIYYTLIYCKLITKRSYWLLMILLEIAVVAVGRGYTID